MILVEALAHTSVLEAPGGNLLQIEWEGTTARCSLWLRVQPDWEVLPNVVKVYQGIRFVRSDFADNAPGAGYEERQRRDFVAAKRYEDVLSEAIWHCAPWLPLQSRLLNVVPGWVDYVVAHSYGSTYGAMSA